MKGKGAPQHCTCRGCGHTWIASRNKGPSTSCGRCGQRAPAMRAVERSREENAARTYAPQQSVYCKCGHSDDWHTRHRCSSSGCTCPLSRAAVLKAGGVA